MDRDHQEAPQRYQTPTRHATYRGHGQDDRWDPQYRQSQSPRHRQRPNSRRHGGKGNRQQNKGSGKGPPQQFQQDNSHGQKGGKNPHGLGREGMAPLPPPPLPSQATMTETGWMNLHPPFPSSTTPSMEMPAPPSLAETKLTKMMDILKKNETELPPEVAKIVKDTSITVGLDKIQNMHDAVENLGKAQQSFEQACFARAQNLASWRQFLHLSVQRWQEYTLQFQAQEKHNLEQISQARDAVKNAQTIFKAMQERGVITIEADDDPALMDEEPAATKTESSIKILSGLEHMTQSLETFANQADQEFVEEQQLKKRARKEEPPEDGSAAAPPGSQSLVPPALTPFGKAHSG